MFFEVVSILLVLLLTLFLVLKYFLLSKAKHISFEDKHVFVSYRFVAKQRFLKSLHYEKLCIVL